MSEQHVPVLALVVGQHEFVVLDLLETLDFRLDHRVGGVGVDGLGGCGSLDTRPAPAFGTHFADVGLGPVDFAGEDVRDFLWAGVGVVLGGGSLEAVGELRTGLLVELAFCVESFLALGVVLEEGHLAVDLLLVEDVVGCLLFGPTVLRGGRGTG